MQVVVFNPSAPKSVYFAVGFFSPKPTEAELLFIIGQIDGFSGKNAIWPGAGSAALSPAAGSLPALCCLLCLFLGQIGQNRAFFFFFPSLLNEPCVHGWGMGWGLKGAVFP